MSISNELSSGVSGRTTNIATSKSPFCEIVSQRVNKTTDMVSRGLTRLLDWLCIY